jgi:hypothetical protein
MIGSDLKAGKGYVTRSCTGAVEFGEATGHWTAFADLSCASGILRQPSLSINMNKTLNISINGYGYQAIDVHKKR